MYDTLVEWNDDFTIRPGLAESYETDGTSWAFHLRRGAQFSNGKEVVADDVIYSLQRVLESPGAGFYGSITDMAAPDDYTVELTLSDTSAPLLAALGGRYAYIIPRDGDKEVDLQQTSLGSGAFQVAEFRQNQELVLVKNPGYWDAENVQIEELIIQIIPDEPTAAAGLRSGQVDIVVFEDSRSYFLTEGDPSIVTTRSPTVRWDVLDFPLDTPPFDNVNLRQAISSALDRPMIMSAAIGGLGTLLGGHPPVLWGALPPEENPFFARDVEKAKQLLEDGGIDTPLQLTLRSIVGYTALNAAAQVIVENLKDIDVEVEIQQLDLGIWIDDFLAGTFDEFTMNAWGGFVDPDLLYYNHLHQPPEGKDFRGWDNEEISQLLDEARFTLGQQEREQLYLEVQRICAELVPWIPLYSSDVITAHAQGIENFTQHASGFYQNLRYVSKE